MNKENASKLWKIFYKIINKFFMNNIEDELLNLLNIKEKIINKNTKNHQLPE